MNKIFFYSIALITCLTKYLLSIEDGSANHMTRYIKNGIQTYGAETVPELQANGCVVLNGTRITHHCIVNGHLRAENAYIEQMQINGQATLEGCLVAKKSVVCGSLTATHSKFTDELSISSERVVFKDCVIDSIHILQIGGYDGVQTVELRGSTKVAGPIIFDSDKGKVVSDPETEIAGGIICGKERR